MKTLCVLSTCLFLVLNFTTPVYASSLVELSLKDLCEKSDNIVIARVISAQSYFTENEKRIFTKIELQVLQTLKGQTRSFEGITLTVLGGTYNGTTTFVIGAPSFTVGEQSILFLSSISLPDGKKNYLVTGLSQGKFNIFADTNTRVERVVREQIDIPLRPERSSTPLLLTNKNAISLSDFVNDIKKYLN